MPENINHGWKTVSSKTVHVNPYFEILHDKITRPNGDDGDFYYLRDAGSTVIVLTIDEAGRVLFIRLFRYPIQRYSLELPGGTADPGEELLAAAKRELLEETGYSAKQWKSIGTLTSCPGMIKSEQTIFVATDLVKPNSEFQNDEEEGIEEVLFYSQDDIVQKIMNSEMHCNDILGALYLARLHNIL